MTPSLLDSDADAPCVVDAQEGMMEDALELLPLVRTTPSPGTELNAAYFYNRRESDGFRFVSYHFPGEDDAPLDDPGLAALMHELEAGSSQSGVPGTDRSRTGVGNTRGTPSTPRWVLDGLTTAPLHDGLKGVFGHQGAQVRQEIQLS